jgi:hypothetical protein
MTTPEAMAINAPIAIASIGKPGIGGVLEVGVVGVVGVVVDPTVIVI